MTPQHVIDFWFGAPGSADDGKPRRAWFVKDAAFDTVIRERFGAAIDKALAGTLQSWDAEGPGGTLARILLLDQFTRNAYRDTPAAFAGDALALGAARAMVDSGADAALAPLRRAFVYLPFEHAEDLQDQARAVALFSALAGTHPGLDDMLDYARRHQAVIARFGRFPHRNAILGRESTPEEVAFLREPGSRF
jgi:uncharacterized protein (DUF924 family)